ncbi:fimbrial protein [Herbaspirillum sp.]|uniref:fimbrial protein n=1 Tax=Herbaspirillum sp. TaxID=1890675 RepID=UPI001B20107A|nr:fimbrial protein [Herbaspirillum sp.]MBO9538279.1 type 1 fimbrial protein [Herbaspirillum sp.]
MKKILIASLFAAAVSPALVHAADGTLSFTGRVDANTCVLTSGTNGTQTVGMSPVNAASLSQAGDVAGLTPFNVTLGNCGNTLKSVRLDFADQTNVDLATGRLKNTARENSNIQIALLDGPNATSAFRLGTPSAQTTPVTSTTAGAATIPLAAQYVATGGAASAGAVTSSIQFTIAYP